MSLVLDLAPAEEEIVRRQASDLGVSPERLAAQLVRTCLAAESPTSRGTEHGLQALTAAALLDSGLVGMWAGRPETVDAPKYARHLRERAQNRVAGA